MPKVCYLIARTFLLSLTIPWVDWNQLGGLFAPCGINCSHLGAWLGWGYKLAPSHGCCSSCSLPAGNSAGLWSKSQHIACPYNLGFSQHGVCVLRDSVSKTKVLRSRKGKLLILLKASTRAGAACSCYTWFAKQSWYQPRFRNRSEVYLSIGIVTKDLPTSLVHYIPQFPFWIFP